LLNNRQPGRRRGRNNNQRPQGNNGGGRGQDNGNRIDNRARGNAPQLLEKYKTLARDSQMQGDRVMTEYYHQFADHYFRVTAEMRARFEENRKQRDDWQGDDGDDGGFDDRPAEAMADDDDGERAYEAQRRQPRDNRDRNEARSDNRDRNDGRNDNRNEVRTDNRERSDYDRPERAERQDRPERAERVARPNPRTSNRDVGNRNNSNRDANGRDGGYPRDDAPLLDALDINVLPPAFGSDGPMSPMPDFAVMDEAPAEAAPKRRGRPRKVVEAE
jgi:hypothetical protein